MPKKARENFHYQAGDVLELYAVFCGLLRLYDLIDTTAAHPRLADSRYDALRLARNAIGNAADAILEAWQNPACFSDRDGRLMVASVLASLGY